jgi:hypothetical protein
VENAVEIPILKLSFSVIFTTILGKIEENLENPILVKRVLFVPKLYKKMLSTVNFPHVFW